MSISGLNMGEPKIGPRNSGDKKKQGKGKGKNKDKGKVITSKSSEDNAKKIYASKEKKSISCSICANEQYENFPLK